MGWFYYLIRLKCENCGMENELSVKKGIKVKDFIKSKDCKCKNCGCIINPNEYSTEWLK